MNWLYLFATIALIVAWFTPLFLVWLKVRRQDREMDRQYEAMMAAAELRMEEMLSECLPRTTMTSLVPKGLPPDSCVTAALPSRAWYLPPERARQIGEQVSEAAEQAAWETLEASRRLDAQALERAKQRCKS